ncbi:cation transporter [Halomonas sp. PR-M31]|uniref:heavy-metal-associated domain-containing protein n=1 Tax=Halomonas sp. PR-M31 TaxID=1471202 RepID=UPI000651747B
MSDSMHHNASSVLTLRIEGMDCGGCERKVEAALGRLQGIEEVSASSVTGSVKIHPQQSTTPSHEVIERTLTSLATRLPPMMREVSRMPLRHPGGGPPRDA